MMFQTEWPFEHLVEYMRCNADDAWREANNGKERGREGMWWTRDKEKTGDGKGEGTRQIRGRWKGRGKSDRGDGKWGEGEH